MDVTVRMYRQGLGDCFLLTFATAGGDRHVMIDCGSLGATTTGVRARDAVAEIATASGKHLDLLVVTHEHKDHVSGFAPKADGSPPEHFAGFTIERVWMAWTEDAADPVARELEMFEDDLITAARLAARALLEGDAPLAEERERQQGLGEGIRELLAFHDADALGADFAPTVHQAMTAAMGMGETPAALLRPGPPVLEPDWLPGVRVYVLGPPRDVTAIARLGDHGDPNLYAFAAAEARDLATSLAFRADGRPLEEHYAALTVDQREALTRQLPFDLRHRLEADHPVARERCPRYFVAGDEWRRIDNDWLRGAAELALQLDGQTNNTSLALAFELIDSGKVLLFPADAQVGNWLSWHGESMKWTVRDPGAAADREVTARDLLRRTVLYKVGHHASHNATMTELGLELMASAELVAMIPVDRAVALNKAWQMPARALYRRLIEKCKGRVLRSDTGWAVEDEEGFEELFGDDGDWDAWRAEQQAADVTVEPRVVTVRI
jgi:hypothetical protein